MDYVDSSVLIGAYFPSDPNHEKCKGYMGKVKSGEIKAITSLFSLAEIGGFISRNSTVENAVEYVNELVKIPNLYVWSTTDFGEFMSVVVGVSLRFGMSGADSIHVVGAFSSPEVKRIATLDRDFRKVESLIEVLIL